jgi:manganese/zinc/iron transport system substrate-binding protein
MLHFCRIVSFRPLLVSFLLALLATVPAGCSEHETADTSTSESKNLPLIVATTAMIGDMAREIAGSTAQVDVLIGTGVDPHQFRATRSHTARIAQADLVIANGLRLEAKLLESLKRGAGEDKLLLVGERLDPGVLLRDAQSNEPDPHLWMDPVLWGEVAALISEELTALMPHHAEEIAANTQEYLAELSSLHAYATTVLESIPEPQRLLVTAHDAFGYLSERYGIEVEGIQGLSTDSEAGLNRIESLVDRLVDRGVRAVFVETSVSDRNVRSLIQGAAAQGHQVAIGGELFSDAMGEAGTYEGTYIGMIDHNVTVIARSLGGVAPEAGMSGRLAVAAEGISTP